MNNSSSRADFVSSVVCFCGTTLFIVWQRHLAIHQQQSRRHFEWYRDRRLHDRLSFHQVPDKGLSNEPHFEGHNVPPPPHRLSSSRASSFGSDNIKEDLEGEDRELDEPPTPYTIRRRTSLAAPLPVHRILRTEYNAKIMPDKVFLIRHGQSMGNTDENLYSTTPDNAMPLTELGWEQAREAGRHLKQQLEEDSDTVFPSVHFILSPYVRTVETFHGIAAAWVDPREFSDIVDPDERLRVWYRRLEELGVTFREDPRIREQDFGNYQNPSTIAKAKKDRHHFGAFYYRFPNGESASDVYDRISTFLDSLWRSFDMNHSRYYVLVTHGISIRVLLARYFRYSIDDFHMLANPRNCEMIALQHDGNGKLELDGRYELELLESGENTQERRTKKLSPRVAGYTYHRKLRTLPKRAVRRVKIRMCFQDD